MAMPQTIHATAIEDAFWLDLDIIEASGGPVLHLLKKGALFDKLFPHGLGEIYFSEIAPGKIKAWKFHARQNALFAVPWGLIRLVLYDGRENSPSYGKLCEKLCGRPSHYCLFRIPAAVWYGFQCVGQSSALVCNCADMAHDPHEGKRMDWNDPHIPYQWPEVKNAR